LHKSCGFLTKQGLVCHLHSGDSQAAVSICVCILFDVSVNCDSKVRLLRNYLLLMRYVLCKCSVSVLCVDLLCYQCSDSKMVERHPNFRLFCCMNPATDVGKKSMPQSIRSR